MSGELTGHREAELESPLRPPSAELSPPGVWIFEPLVPFGFHYLQIDSS